MSDPFSLSFLQIFSILSFFTSCLALICVGSVHRLHQHKFFNPNTQPSGISQAQVDGKSAQTQQIWSWTLSGLPVLSLNAIIGEDEAEYGTTEEGLSVGGLESIGHQVLKMNWPSTKVTETLVAPSIAPPPSKRLLSPPPLFSQTPASMAKLIMSRHTQHRGRRIPRAQSQSSGPGMLKPTPLSRFVESAPSIPS